jgi:hypothetical protein
MYSFLGFSFNFNTFSYFGYKDVLASFTDDNEFLNLDFRKYYWIDLNY